MAQKKTFKAPLELKSDGKGFEAVFATLNVVDKDGDLTEHGAFGEQLVTVEGWGHDMGLPVGKGRVFERGNEAICKGQFFMDTTAGRDHYQVVKNLGPQTEWSYTFQILRSAPGRGPEDRRLLDLEVHGVSPVTRGAGEGTRTVRIAKRYGSDNLAALEGWEHWISADPKDAWRQLQYAYFDITGKSMCPDVPSNPAEAKAAILALSGPEAVTAAIDDELFTGEIEALEARVKQGSDHPTNLDRLREAVAQDLGPDLSDAYIETHVALALQTFARQFEENNPGISASQARQQVARWARQAAS